MTARKPPLQPNAWPETTGQDSYDWLSAETVIKIALQAYYANCRSHDALPDDPGALQGMHRNCRAWLAEHIAVDFEALLNVEGVRRSVPGFHDWGAAAFALAHAPRSDDEQPAVSVCPVLDSGPAPDIHRNLFINRINASSTVYLHHRPRTPLQATHNPRPGPVDPLNTLGATFSCTT